MFGRSIPHWSHCRCLLRTELAQVWTGSCRAPPTPPPPPAGGMGRTSRHGGDLEVRLTEGGSSQTLLFRQTSKIPTRTCLSTQTSRTEVDRRNLLRTSKVFLWRRLFIKVKLFFFLLQTLFSNSTHRIRLCFSWRYSAARPSLCDGKLSRVPFKCVWIRYQGMLNVVKYSIIH